MFFKKVAGLHVKVTPGEVVLSFPRPSVVTAVLALPWLVPVCSWLVQRSRFALAF